MRDDQKSWVEAFTRTTSINLEDAFRKIGTGIEDFAELSRTLLELHRGRIELLQTELEYQRNAHRILSSSLPNESQSPSLTAKQELALRMLTKWVETKTAYYVLKGYAGTGKTFMLQHFAKALPSDGIIFSSPTNKATKVLRRVLKGYKCKTIYSVLGLKMVQREDELVLTPSDEKVDLSGVDVIVVDEASMLNSELLTHIEQARRSWGVKFLFVGDPAQLPPVGEDRSPVWSLECQSTMLTEVVRHDNQILTLATHVRKHIEDGTRLEPIYLDEGKRCAWQLTHRGFVERIRKHARRGFVDTKAVAWRNKTVDHLNEIIREEMFSAEQRAFGRWIDGDRIVITEPVEEYGKIVATVDEEGIVRGSAISADVVSGHQCYHLQVEMEDGRTLHLRAIHEDAEDDYQRELGRLATEARQPGNGKLWRRFWGLKYRFHSIRHSFAITAHRAQGSTFTNVFADASDILKNPDRETAYRCLYVAVSRPSEKLFVTGLP